MPKIELYPHNQAALNHLEEALKYTRRAAVIQPTGTGKSFVALAFIERRPNNSFLYLAPSTHIFNQLKHHAGHTEVLLHTTMMTYQKLCLLHEDELGKLEPDYIILDEFHRCGADDWGSAVDHLLALYVECFLIGFTATPVRYLDKAGTRDMSEELFHGSIASYYTLQDAINDKVLPVPHYVLGDILMNERVSSLETALTQVASYGRARTAGYSLLESLKRNMAEAQGIDEIFKCHMPNRFAKLIVFCRNLEHIAQCREDMHRWLGPGKKIREYVCRSDEKAADIELNAFAGDNERNAIRLLYCVDMLNEGIHIKDVDGVVMLRPTISPIVYLQQIGRCLACSSDGSTSPVIFDLVNNYESARVEESGQRVFNIEFSHHPSSGKGKNTPIPFYMSGVPTQFEAILEKFDHLFTRAGRWDFCYSILQEFYHEYGQYPHIEEPEDYRGQPRGDVLHYLLNKRLGAEVDYIVKGVDQENNVVAASRLEAMALKRREYYFRTDRDGNYQIYEGIRAEARVISVIRAGIFIDLFGAECYIPLRELSYQRWVDAAQHYQPGQRVLVKVLEVDRSDRSHPRVSASVKQAMENPYEKALKKYVVGNRYVGTVSMVDLNGVFVSLDGGVDCLCTYPKRGRPPRGARATVRILGINHENNRIWGVITHMSTTR